MSAHHLQVHVAVLRAADGRLSRLARGGAHAIGVDAVAITRLARDANLDRCLEDNGLICQREAHGKHVVAPSKGARLAAPLRWAPPIRKAVILHEILPRTSLSNEL